MDLGTFIERHLDCLEGLRDAPPSLEALPEPERGAALTWLGSLKAARGINPYAERPPTAELLDRVFTKNVPEG